MIGDPPRGTGAAPVVLALVAGLVFGAGLLLSGMTDPARVVGFLDVGGAWDPRLAFVLGGAVAVHAAAWRWLRRGARRPWFDERVDLPTRRHVDRRLLAGAAIFGVGWGLAGVCPGPGLVAAAAGGTGALAFVAAMIAGMLVARPR